MPTVSTSTAFHALHHTGTPFLLPNAWDFASAAVLAEAGFAAIGTTSLGVALAHGLPDGAGRTRTQTLDLARLLRHVPTMVTVDVEGGFSDDPAAVGALAAELAAAGAVGLNLEDGRPDGSLSDPGLHQDKIRAIKQAAPDLFVNARTDTHWLAERPPPISATLTRVAAYREAGADGVFVPGLVDENGVRTVVAEAGLPVNVLLAPLHRLSWLGELGVARVSTGSMLFRAAMHAVAGTALAARDSEPITQGLPTYADVARLTDPTP